MMFGLVGCSLTGSVGLAGMGRKIFPSGGLTACADGAMLGADRQSIGSLMEPMGRMVRVAAVFGRRWCGSLFFDK